MNARPDLERVVTDWLNDEAVTAGSDGILAATLVRVAAVNQDRAPRLLRIPNMHAFAKLAIGVAVVAVVAVVGINLLPARNGGVGGGPAVTPSLAPTASPPPSPSPSPTPAEAFPSPGPLTAGRYQAVLDGIPFSFNVKAGWTADQYNDLLTGEYGQPDAAQFVFWSSAPDNVYGNPCEHTPLNPPPGDSSAALAAAVATLPGTDLIAGPSATALDNRPTEHVVIRVRDDIACGPMDFWRWYDDSTGGPSGGYRNGAGRGATIRVWIIDVDGRRLWIDGETFEGADEALGQTMQELIGSIRFE